MHQHKNIFFVIVFFFCNMFYLSGMENPYLNLINDLETAIQNKNEELFVDKVQALYERLSLEDTSQQLLIYEDLLHTAVRQNKDESLLQFLCNNYSQLVARIDLEEQQLIIQRVGYDLLDGAVQHQNMPVLKMLAALLSLNPESDAYCKVSEAIKGLLQNSVFTHEEEPSFRVKQEEPEPKKPLSDSWQEKLSDKDIVDYFSDLLNQNFEEVCSEKCFNIPGVIVHLTKISRAKAVFNQDEDNKTDCSAIAKDSLMINGCSLPIKTEINDLFNQAYEKTIYANKKIRKRVNFLVKMAQCAVTFKNKEQMIKLLDNLPIEFSQWCKNHVRFSSKFIWRGEILDFPGRLPERLDWVIFDGKKRLLCKSGLKNYVLEIGKDGLYQKSIFDSRSNQHIPLEGDQWASCDGNIISIWDDRTGKCVKKRTTGHKDTIKKMAMLSGNRIASISKDNIVKIWNTVTGACRTFEGAAEAIASNSKDLLAVKMKEEDDEKDSVLYLWDFSGKKRIKRSINFKLYEERVRSKEILDMFFLDNTNLVMQAYRGFYGLNLETGDCYSLDTKCHLLTHDIYPSGLPYTYAQGLPYFVCCKVDEDLLFYHSYIQVNDVKSKEKFRLKHSKPRKIKAIAHVSDSILIASYGDNYFRIWDFRTSQCLNTLKFYADIQNLFCIDGEVVLFRGCSSKESFIALRSMNTLEEVLNHHIKDNAEKAGFKKNVTIEKNRLILFNN